MPEQPYRLGDLIDDHCPRCRLLLNHAIASMVEGQVVKVICQTCFTEHAFQHGKGGKKKATGGRVTLFDQVLSQLGPSASAAPPAPRSQKKPPAVTARYISRHKTKPPRSGL